MATKPVLLFTTSTGNLGDTTVQIELARACAADFEPIFLCYGFKFQHLIQAAGFRTLFPPPYRRSRIAPRPEKFVRQIEAEAAIMRRYRPVAVINKHEMGPRFSARLAGVPLVWVLPYAWTRLCQENQWAGRSPLLAAQHWFNGQPLPEEATFLWPYQETARRLGLTPPATFHDLFSGDLILIHELPELVGITEIPAQYRLVGPVFAHYPGELPAALQALDPSRPILYFALGSSGDPELIPTFLALFAARPEWQIIAPIEHLLAATGRPAPANVIVTGLLPALAANRLANLAITHGGLGTLATACLAGTPILALGMFPEQELNIAHLVHWGNARALSRAMLNQQQFLPLVDRALADQTLAAQAQAMQRLFSQQDGAACAAAHLRHFLAKQTVLG